MSVWKRISTFLQTMEWRLSLWQVLFGGTGLVTSFSLSAWAAYATDWLRAYGPIAWVAAGFLGLFCFFGMMAIFYRARLWAVEARLVGMIQTAGDRVNPLDEIFHRKRIKIDEFVLFIHREAAGKTFDRCELIGPNVLLFHGTATFHSPSFVNCDFVVVKDNTPVYNVVVFKDCNFLSTKFYQMTILVPERLLGSFPVVPWMTPNLATQATPPSLPLPANPQQQIAQPPV